MTNGLRLKIIASGRLTRPTGTRQGFLATGPARTRPKSWKNNRTGAKIDPLMKKLPPLTLRALALLLALAPSASLAQEIPKNDPRLTEIRHLDLTYDFPGYRSKEEWLDRAARLKKQILVSAGLWPAPAKTPINATIFGKVDRGDYIVEKVYFESYPGV